MATTPKRKRPLLQVTVNKELKDRIIENAQQEGLSISEYAESLLMKSLGVRRVTQLVWDNE